MLTLNEVYWIYLNADRFDTFEADDFFSDIIIAADLNFLHDTIRDHFSTNRYHEENPTNKQKVLDFIQTQFKAYGLDTELQPFLYTPTNTTFTNVIGIRKGSNYDTPDDKLIGLGAHFDTVDNTSGVDDNGSGMAAMLHVMKDFHESGSKWKHTMIFVAFDGEELGYVGSHAFVKDWWLPFVYSANPAKKSYGFFILDTIMAYNESIRSQFFPSELKQAFPGTIASITSDGGRGDFITMMYRGAGDGGDDVLTNRFNSSWQTGQQTEFDIQAFAIPTADYSDLSCVFGQLLRSDHRAFWQFGFPAIFLTDTGNFRGLMQTCYHNPCDDVSTMLTIDNIRFLGKTTDSLIASMDSFAVRIATSTNISPRTPFNPSTLILTILPIVTNLYGRIM